MNIRQFLTASAILLLLVVVSTFPANASSPARQHLLYVASPGIRNYTEYGGVGVLVFDIDHHYKFVRRIPTWDVPAGEQPQNVKGIVASANTGRVYVSTITRTIAIDAVSGKTIWDKAFEGGCDRLAISPDGKILYIPQFEGASWHVVNADTGEVITTITTNSGSHNTIYSADGKRVYLAGLASPLLSVVNAATQKVEREVGPFSNPIRPFTINGANSLVFVNVNGLLGFEVGDLVTGKKLYRVEVAGYQQGEVKRHGVPSHGIALTPDEKEMWVADCANQAIHIFDATLMPPKQMSSLKMRDCVGWISFSMDGKVAYSSTGEMVDVASKKIIATLRDEAGHDVQSEKLLDLTIENRKVVKVGDQFGIGRR